MSVMRGPFAHATPRNHEEEGRKEGKSVAMTRTDLREVLKGGTGFYLTKLFFPIRFYEVSRFFPSRYSFFHFF